MNWLTKWFKERVWPKVKKYVWNILVALDQVLNVLLFGYPDETFSARVYRKAEAGQWFWRALRWIINTLFFWQDNHCRLSYENEKNRAQCPREYQI